MKTKLQAIFSVIFALLFLSQSSNAQTTLLGWQFSDVTPAVVGNEATATSNIIDAKVETSILSRGAGLKTEGVTLARGFSTTFTSYTSGNTTKTDALTNNEYFEFFFTSKVGSKANLGSIENRLRRSSNGPNVYRWMYSLDNAPFVEIGSADITFTDNNTNGVIQSPIDLSAITELQDLDNTHTVRFRIYMWGVSSSTGTFAFARYASGDATPVLELRGTSTTLPVSLTSFTGKKENNGVKLTWKTLSETNNSHYEILRSADDKVFESITIVNGKGNSNTESTYTFTDATPINGNNYYTLKQVDFDGTAKNVALCVVNAAFQKSSFQVLNTADLSTVKCAVSTGFSRLSSIKITDIAGNVKANVSVSLQQGTHVLDVEAALPKGIYVATFSNGMEQMVTKFSK